MEYIKLISIEKSDRKLRYNWNCSEKLRGFFTGNDFVIEYPENIENVPDGVLAIPFVAVALPIVWLTDSKLIIQELDHDFNEAIPKIKEGFAQMYPEASFKGTLEVNTVKDCTPKGNGKTAVFFSGGLDATTTLLRHIEERPALISLWGADVAYDNAEGWKTVEQCVSETANQYNLEQITIRTMFRNVEDETVLTKTFGDVLHTGWWYGIKHGIGIISHAAPLAWKRGISTVYIASSNCIADGLQQCASDPRIDNNICYCGCKTVHDGYELSRQDKTSFIVEYHKKHYEHPINIRACWKSEHGDNCCQCEKCYRTMAGFWAEGEDPKDYGFNYPPNALKRMYEAIALHNNDLPPYSWSYIKMRLNENWESIKNKSYAQKIEWIKDFDFFNLSENTCRKRYMKTWKLKSRIVKMFPNLYKLYIRIRGYYFE